MSDTVAPVSVIVPCYRCTGTIEATIRSVATQTLVPAQVILVDDGSGDETIDVLNRIASSYRPGWIRVIAMEKNGGPSRARNRGWAEANQDYIAFLDADDSWHPMKLELVMNVLRSEPSIAFVAHRNNVQRPDAPPPKLIPPIRHRTVGASSLYFRNPFPTASVVLRRDLPFRFDETRRRAEDYLLWAQILLSGNRCVKINQTLASWHKEPFGAGGLTGDLKAMNIAARSARRALLTQGFLKQPWFTLAEIYSELRYLRRRILTDWRSRHWPVSGPRSSGSPTR